MPDDYDAASTFARVGRELSATVAEPSLSYVILTDTCNFRCSYCFIENALPFTGNSISRNQADSIARILLRLSAGLQRYSVIFYGGEPLINKDTMYYLVETLNRSAPGRFQFSMVTNGSLVDDEVARRLATLGFSVGVSLDGWAELNAPRQYVGGGDTFFDAVRAVATLKKHKVNVGVSCTVTKANVGHLVEIVDFVSKLRVKGIGFNIVLDKLAQSHAIQDPAELAHRLFEASIRAMDLGIGEDRIGRRRIEPFFKEEFRPYDCPAYGRQVFFSPKGTVGPCQAFYTTPLFQEQATDEFNPRKSPSIQRFLDMGGTLKSSECMNCPAIAICGGSCPYDVFTKTGTLGHLDPYFCTFMRETLRLLIEFYYDRVILPTSQSAAPPA